MLLSRAEIVGWFFSIVVIAGMGFLALHGRFNSINHARAAVASTVTVHIVNNSKTIGQYKPATITLKVGQSATFVNDSSVDHTVTASNGTTFGSPNIPAGGTWVLTAKKAGKYPYICEYHQLMKGTVIVTS
jgi:plastocyanin